MASASAPASAASIATTRARIAALPPAVTPFQRSVYCLLLDVPAGHVTTYGLLARRLGASARAVGRALRNNPLAPEVPCHRVVAAGGALGGFKGAWYLPRKGGASASPAAAARATVQGEREERAKMNLKKKLLRQEGVRFDAKGRVLGTPFGTFA